MVDSAPFVFIIVSVHGAKARELALSQGVNRFILSSIESQALLRQIQRCLNGVRHGEDSDR